MSIKLDITNFRIIREAHLIDDQPLSVIVGYNEAGKSSLIGALQWVLTGQAFNRQGKACDALVSWGEERMHTRLELGTKLFNRTRSGGDSLKENAGRLGVAADVLPLLFHQRMNGDGGNKHLKAFLQGAIADAFIPAEHFAKDPDLMPRIERARRAGALLTKQVIKFCEEQRANCRAPTQPLMPSVHEVNDVAMRELDNAQTVADQAVTRLNGELAEMETLVIHLQAVSFYLAAEARYAAARAQAAQGDPLGARRAQLEAIVSLRPAVLRNIAATLAPVLTDAPAELAVFEAAAKLVEEIQADAQATLQRTPAPVALGAPPVLAPAPLKAWEELGKPQDLTPLMQYATAEAVRLRAEHSAAVIAAGKAKANRDQALANRGTWDAYRKALPAWEDTKQAVEVEWQRWDQSAKTIAAAELEHIKNAGTAFEGLITDLSAALLNGRKITVSPTDGIQLVGNHFDDASVSTQWRIEVCVMAAIAKYLKSPLLLIDGADILDARNSLKFTDFVLRHIVPSFSHTIITATCRAALEDEKPLGAGATKWTLDKGVLTKVSP